MNQCKLSYEALKNIFQLWAAEEMETEKQQNGTSPI